MKGERMCRRSKGGDFFVSETRVATVVTMGSVSGWGPRFWEKVLGICN